MASAGRSLSELLRLKEKLAVMSDDCDCDIESPLAKLRLITCGRDGDHSQYVAVGRAATFLS